MKESELQLAAQEAADNARHVELLVSGGMGHRLNCRGLRALPR